jgi:hypothetical protein
MRAGVTLGVGLPYQTDRVTLAAGQKQHRQDIIDIESISQTRVNIICISSCRLLYMAK